MDVMGLLRIFPILLLAVCLPGAEAVTTSDTAGIIAGVVVIAVLIIIVIAIVAWYFIRSKNKRKQFKKKPPVFVNGAAMSNGHGAAMSSGQQQYMYPAPYMDGHGGGYDQHMPYMIPTKTVETYYAPVAPPPQMLRIPMEGMYPPPRSRGTSAAGSSRVARSRKKSEESPPERDVTPPPPTPPPPPPPPPPQEVVIGPAVAVIRHQQTMETKRSQYETKVTSLEIMDDALVTDMPDDEYVRETILKVPAHITTTNKDDDFVIIDYVDHNKRSSTIIHNISSSSDQRSSFEKPESSSTPRERTGMTELEIQDIESKEYHRRQRQPDLSDVRL